MTDPNADLADSARRITHAWMAHLGYEPGQIAAAETQEHADLCEFNGQFWECHDEDGGSHHPVRDEMDNAAAMVMFVLERLGPTPASAHSVDDLQDIRSKWLRFCGHDIGTDDPCICPKEDHRPVIAALVTEVETLRAEVARRIPPQREGCCRAAVDSDGQAHDHAGWYGELVRARAEVARLEGERDELRIDYRTACAVLDRLRIERRAYHCGSCLQGLHEECSRDGCDCPHEKVSSLLGQLDEVTDQRNFEADRADKAESDLAALHAETARLRTELDRARAHVLVDQMAPSGPLLTRQGDDRGEVAGTDTVEAEEGTQRAQGGVIAPGQIFIIGERGPEEVEICRHTGRPHLRSSACPDPDGTVVGEIEAPVWRHDCGHEGRGPVPWRACPGCGQPITGVAMNATMPQIVATGSYLELKRDV
jgi:hypothetical protein